MKRIVSAILLTACIAPVAAQDTADETYFGLLGNILVSPDSSRELDGIGLRAVYGGGKLLGLPIEYGAFYDTLEPENGPNVDFFRSGLGADVLLGFDRLGVPDFAGIQPYALGGGGLVYGDAVPEGDEEFDFFANVGIGAMSAPLTAHGWRIRGDVKYVYENLGDGYFDLHAALGVQIPWGAAAVASARESTRVVEARSEDGDGDGITDDADRCPGTRGGETVGPDGCVPQAEPTAVLALEGVTFESSSDQLRDDSTSVLDEAVTTLQSRYPNAQVEVAGHTDDSGDRRYNLELSLRRAEAVRQYLIQAGVNAGRLSAEGYGEAQPAADNSTVEGRAQNRRVELRVRE